MSKSLEKELLSIFEVVKKAADAAASNENQVEPEEARCLDALKQLRCFPVTMPMLVSTQVGKRLRNLTKHPREKIQARASELLELWKSTVIEEKTRDNKKNSDSDDKHSVKVEVKSNKAETIKAESVKVEQVSKAENVKVEKVTRPETVELEKLDRIETVKVEKIKEEKQAVNMKKTSSPIALPKLTTMVKCNDSLRDKIREILAEAFSKVSSEANEDIIEEVNACDPIRAAVSVESFMLEKLGRANGAQKFKYRSIVFNLKDANNPDLRRKVLLGEVKLEKLINMTPEEMASDQRKRENNQIKEKALFECERGGPPKATTDQFKCGRCGQRKTTYYQLQTRSADEPMTTFVTCVNCNNHWKFC